MFEFVLKVLVLIVMIGVVIYLGMGILLAVHDFIDDMNWRREYEEEGDEK